MPVSNLIPSIAKTNEKLGFITNINRQDIMAKIAKRRSHDSAKDFIPMEKTRALLGELWDHWRVTLGHTPDMAKRMMTAAIQEMHKTEKATMKKLPAKKATVKKAIKKKVGAVKAKVTKKVRKLKAK